MSKARPSEFDIVQRLAKDLQRRIDELETLIQVIPVPIAIATGPDCRIVRVNPAFGRLFGISPDRNASLNPSAGASPGFRLLRDGRELQPYELPLEQATMHGNVLREMPLEILRDDGTRASVYAFAAPLFDEDDRPRGAVAAFVDISERRGAEERQRFLANASAVLASSLDYETTLASVARLAVPALADYCAVDIVTLDGTIRRVEHVHADPTMEEIVRGLRRYPPTTRIDSAAARSIRTGEPIVVTDVSAELMERASQDEEHRRLLRALNPRSFMMIPMRARGRTLGLLTFGSSKLTRRYTDADLPLALDLAQRAALAVDNARLYGEAQEATRLRDEFLATLSHELRTPLNAILGWAQLLRSGALDEPGARRAIESIERNTHAQGVLINDLLDVSRVITGKLRLRDVPLDLPAIIQAAVDAVGPAARAKGLRIDVALEPIAHPIAGDPDRLQQVVWNLLSNAVKFTEHGHIELRLEDRRSAVQIKVIDTGLGIDAGFLPYVFERFRQSDSATTRSQGGLGLGLSIVKHLVELHGGTVGVESAGRGHGSAFAVTLPVQAEPLKGMMLPLDPSVEQATFANSLRGVRVLCMDDDADSREVALATLQSAGAEVVAVASGQAAVDVLESFRPAVLLLDIAMPGEDGYKVLARIRTLPLGTMPAIALSAHASDDDVVRAHQAGFRAHLAKPVDRTRLARAVADAAAASLTKSSASG